MCIFQPLEVVDRGSETQPQVVENWRVIKHIEYTNKYHYRSAKPKYIICLRMKWADTAFQLCTAE